MPCQSSTIGPQWPWSVYSHRQTSAQSARRRHLAAQRRQRTRHGTFGIGRAGSDRVLVLRDAEEDHRRHAEARPARGTPRRARPRSSGRNQASTGSRDAALRPHTRTAAPPGCPATAGSRAPAAGAPRFAAGAAADGLGSSHRSSTGRSQDVAPGRRQAPRPAAPTPARRRWPPTGQGGRRLPAKCRHDDAARSSRAACRRQMPAPATSRSRASRTTRPCTSPADDGGHEAVERFDRHLDGPGTRRAPSRARPPPLPSSSSPDGRYRIAARRARLPTSPGGVAAIACSNSALPPVATTLGTTPAVASARGGHRTDRRDVDAPGHVRPQTPPRLAPAHRRPRRAHS